VNHPRHPRDDDRALTLALFRYGLIAELVERVGFDDGERSRLVHALAAEMHYQPGVGPRRISVRTLYGWLHAYRSSGLEGLLPRQRKDQGSSRVLDVETIDRAVRLRTEQPKRPTGTLLDILRLERGLPTGFAFCHRSTLDRHLLVKGASRRQLRTLGEKRTIKMVFENFGDLWVGDYHHGPVVLGTNGQPTTAKLGAFIDHCTRYPVADRYYLSEDLSTLRDCLLRALLVWGPAARIYVDRGAVYRSEQLAWSLSRIAAHCGPGQRCILIHSRAYYSQGRGVIERWWQTVEPFEDEVAARGEILTLHELNCLWEAYKTERYLNAVHSEIGCTPAQAIAKVTPRPLDPEVAKELFLVRAVRKVHKKNGCVPIEGRHFLCESFLRNQKVQVRYDPSDLSSVLIFSPDGQKRIQRAFPQPINAIPEPHPQPEVVAQSVDYLALLREEFDRKLLEHARPLAYTKLEPSPGFGPDDFVSVIVDLAGLELRKSDRQELDAFWLSFAPIPEPLVRIAVEHAVRLHGRNRHLRIYLHAVRTLVLAQLKTKEVP
jgi:transposase InsO family protein